MLHTIDWRKIQRKQSQWQTQPLHLLVRTRLWSEVGLGELLQLIQVDKLLAQGGCGMERPHH